MPRAQQHHAHEGAAHSQGIGNFVVAHVRVIAHHQRHPRPRAHFLKRLAHFFAGALLDQFFQLAWLGMLERHAFHVFGFFVLADFSAAQNVPAMIRGYFIQPRGERPRRVVLAQLALQFHEYFHRGIFRVLPRGHSTPAEAKDRRSIVAVKLAPSLRVTRLGTGDRLRRFNYSRRAHPAWSLRFHRLVRTKARKYYILQTAAILCLNPNPFIAWHLEQLLKLFRSFQQYCCSTTGSSSWYSNPQFEVLGPARVSHVSEL